MGGNVHFQRRMMGFRIAGGVLGLAILLISVLSIGSFWFLSSPEQLPDEAIDVSPNLSEYEAAHPKGSHPLDPVLEMAKRSLTLHRARDRDYTALMVKRFRLGKRLGEQEIMRLKLRSRDSDPPAEQEFQPRPIDVYLGFLEPRSLAGREVIWREGQHDNQMIVHEAGLLNFTRLHLAPTSRLAMLGNRYPIYDIGIERLLVKFIERGMLDRSLGPCEVFTRDDFLFEGRRCQRIEILHPQKEVEIDGDKLQFDFYRVEIDVDLEYGLPIHYASYLWPDAEGGEPVLDEEFTYRELQLNCNLDDQDFDPDNPDYRYPSR